MKKIIIPLLALTIQSVGLSNTSLERKTISSINRTRLKSSNDSEASKISALKERYLNALKPYYNNSNNLGMNTLASNSSVDADLFYSDYPYYNQGGEVIALDPLHKSDFDKLHNPSRTELLDVMARYYDPDQGEYLYNLVDNYSFKHYGMPSGLLNHPEPNLNVRGSWAFYTKNNNSYSTCLTSAAISIIKSMSFTHKLEKPTDGTKINSTTPYILNDQLGHKISKKESQKHEITKEQIDVITSIEQDDNYKLMDTLRLHFDEDQFNKLGLKYSGKTYKGFALVEENLSNPKDYGYMYNQLCKMAAVMDSAGADTLIKSMATYLEENSLSSNKYHRFTMTGTRKVINGLDIQSDFINYIANYESGVIGGDNDFVWPNSNNSSDKPGGHAFVIVGWGITSKYNTRLKQHQDVSEIIYDMGDGQLAAMPAFDLCDWFDLTIKKQNKEWFGWRTSKDENNWHRG